MTEAAQIARTSPRKIKIQTNVNPYTAGSVMIWFGNTQVLVTATVEESVPRWMDKEGRGWVTGEYAMLPSATHTRSRRERKSVSGRTQEIQRLIGRSLRAAIDLEKLGERSILIDCDVIVADGGTRTASISGAFVALSLAIKKLIAEKKISTSPIIHQIGALSIGINSQGEIIADLNYEEDSTCETDMNLVMTRDGSFIEIQGTAEGKPFSKQELEAVLSCGKTALSHVFSVQDEVLK